MPGEGRCMYWERASPQNTGPFRVHDAFVEGALLDLRSRLARGPCNGNSNSETLAQARARAQALRSTRIDPVSQTRERQSGSSAPTFPIDDNSSIPVATISSIELTTSICLTFAANARRIPPLAHTGFAPLPVKLISRICSLSKKTRHFAAHKSLPPQRRLAHGRPFCVFHASDTVDYSRDVAGQPSSTNRF